MDETKENYPLITDGLITYLDRNFPNVYPTTELSLYELGRGAGEQRLIQHLKQVKQWSEEQNV